MLTPTLVFTRRMLVEFGTVNDRHMFCFTAFLLFSQLNSLIVLPFHASC